MANNESTKRPELFFPYYINQSRLLDIYAILNNGYSEYSEITTSVSVEKVKGAKGDASISGGFKLLNIGGNLSGDIEKKDVQGDGNKEKKVQTITSILSLVRDSLQSKGYLCDIATSHPWDFVTLPVVLQINSIKSLLSEMSELLKLCTNMQKIGAQVKGVFKDNKEIEVLLKSIQTLFAGEEIIHETDEYAIIGNIVDDNLYQSARADLICTELKCLAQVKRIFPQGTELMRNTIFTKIKDTDAKEKLIEAVQQLSSGNVFEFEATAISSIKDKPVYELEIIALYQ
jgi:hypothetical protein